VEAEDTRHTMLCTTIANSQGCKTTTDMFSLKHREPPNPDQQKELNDKKMKMRLFLANLGKPE
jgi:hypothetical protein